MTYRIETRNHYLRCALDFLFSCQRVGQDTCIIDISSFASLQAILQCVRQHRDATRFLFIGDSGVHSRALQQLVTLESKQPLLSYSEQLHQCPGVSYDMAIDVLLAHRSMEDYSHQDKAIVYSLLMRESMHSAARLIGISNKQLYQRIGRLTKKLNQVSGLQTHLFLRLEFHPEYVRARIDEQGRASLHRLLRARH